jgi:hypothetical protein
LVSCPRLGISRSICMTRPNKAAPVPVAAWLHAGPSWRRVTEERRSACSRAVRGQDGKPLIFAHRR